MIGNDRGGREGVNVGVLFRVGEDGTPGTRGQTKLRGQDRDRDSDYESVS